MGMAKSKSLAQRSQTSLSRNLGIGSALVLLFFCVIVTVQAMRAHNVALERGRVMVSRLTRIESDHVSLIFHSVNLTLRAISERQHLNSLFGGRIPKDLENHSRLWVEQTPQIAGMLISDDKGKIILISSKQKHEGWVNENESVEKEEFFKHHQSLPTGNAQDPDLFIGVRNSPDKKDGSLVIISRKLYKLDGSFGGVVAAAIDSAYFFDFFRSIELGSKINLALAIDSGLIFLSPSGGNGASLLGMVKEVFAEGNAEERAGIFDRELDGKNYIVSYEKLSGLPVTTSLVLDRKEILKDWSADRMTDLVFLSLFSIFGVVLFSMVIAMARQIRRAEESEARALLANQAKSEFLAKMSHEFRTPLNAIIGFSEMIDSGYFGPLNRKQKERIHDINLCGTHLLQLINDILEFSKGEADKLELRESDIDIPRVIEESVRMMKERAQAGGITLSSGIAQGMPFFRGDERKLKQILLNLLSNAVKFTPRGGKVNVSSSLDNYGNLEISVSDTGIGIAQEDIPVALSVFGQVSKSQTYEGTGLGLPLCKMLTELHGGRLSIESELKAGTTVIVTLPASRVLVKDNRREESLVA